MKEYIHIPFVRLKIGRFLFLLAAIILFCTVRPFLEGFVRISILVDIFATLILASGVYAASSTRYMFRTALLIAFPTLIVHWAHYFVQIEYLFLAGKILGGLFYGFMIVIILNYLFKEKQITADTIAGAICAYFLIGLMWASIFAILEFLQPASFQISSKLQTEPFSFAYYSYVTLTTLGYGDVTPISAPARSFSFLEAITGQIYLATLVARLVAINIIQSVKKESP